MSNPRVVSKNPDRSAQQSTPLHLDPKTRVKPTRLTPSSHASSRIEQLFIELDIIPIDPITPVSNPPATSKFFLKRPPTTSQAEEPFIPKPSGPISHTRSKDQAISSIQTFLGREIPAPDAEITLGETDSSFVESSLDQAPSKEPPVSEASMSLKSQDAQVIGISDQEDKDKNTPSSNLDTFPPNSILTSAGWDSLNTDRPITQRGQPGKPAVLAFSKPIGKNIVGTKAKKVEDSRFSLVLEILDYDSERTWSEDELYLVEQVIDQLSLALENARLL